MVRGFKKTDTQIHRDVLEELKWDSRVDETEVGVEVDNGVVTLTGTVTSWAKRMAAQEAARRVVGVLDVANDIKVKSPGGFSRTDTEIAQAVRHALEWDVYVPDEKISSTVTDGMVTLEGMLDRWSQRADAERAVRNLAGVKGVVNQIKIRPASVPTGTVRHAIVQDPSEAVAPNMPRAALAMDGHQILKIDQIGEVLRTAAVSRASASSSTSP